MKKYLLALAIAALCSPALAQIPTMPPNTVLGRLGISAGPAEAIPFTIFNSQFATQGSSPPLDNQGFWGLGIFQFGATLSFNGVNQSGTSDQFGLLVDVGIPQINATASFEKDAIGGVCFIAEPNPGFTTEKACVAIEGRAYILNTNPTGQAYGGLDWTEIQSGGIGDGAIIGREIDVFNNGGTDQKTPWLNTGLRKVGMQAVSTGTSNSTAALEIIGAASGGASLWHKGLTTTTGELVPPGTDACANFIELVATGSADSCDGTSPFAIWKVRSDGLMAQTYIAGAGQFDFFQNTTNGESSIVYGILPTTGGNTDQFDHQFWFSDSTGVHYLGAEIFAAQVTATHGSVLTALGFATASSGSATTTALLTSAALYPQTDGTPTLGKAGARWNEVMIVPQAISAITGTACGATNEGALAIANNALNGTNGGQLSSTGTVHVLAVCLNSQWTIMGGH